MIVKAHSSHPGTSELVASAIVTAAPRQGRPVSTAVNAVGRNSAALVAKA